MLWTILSLHMTTFQINFHYARNSHKRIFFLNMVHNLRYFPTKFYNWHPYTSAEPSHTPSPPYNTKPHLRGRGQDSRKLYSRTAKYLHVKFFSLYWRIFLKRYARPQKKIFTIQTNLVHFSSSMPPFSKLVHHTLCTYLAWGWGVRAPSPSLGLNIH